MRSHGDSSLDRSGRKLDIRRHRLPGPAGRDTFSGRAARSPTTSAPARLGILAIASEARAQPMSLMPLPFATMALAQVIAFMVLALPRTPATIMPALAAFPRPVPAPGAIGGRVGVWNRSLDEAAR